MSSEAHAVYEREDEPLPRRLQQVVDVCGQSLARRLALLALADETTAQILIRAVPAGEREYLASFDLLTDTGPDATLTDEGWSVVRGFATRYSDTREVAVAAGDYDEALAAARTEAARMTELSFPGEQGVAASG